MQFYVVADEKEEMRWRVVVNNWSFQKEWLWCSENLSILRMNTYKSSVKEIHLNDYTYKAAYFLYWKLLSKEDTYQQYDTSTVTFLILVHVWSYWYSEIYRKGCCLWNDFFIWNEEIVRNFDASSLFAVQLPHCVRKRKLKMTMN